MDLEALLSLYNYCWIDFSIFVPWYCAMNAFLYIIGGYFWCSVILQTIKSIYLETDGKLVHTITICLVPS